MITRAGFWWRGTHPDLLAGHPPDIDEEERARWEPKPGKIGICCSGGGIRSAAYNLGALQALQKAGKLQRAAYLAAVAGGSYIAAAFSIVQKQHSAHDHSTAEKTFRDAPPYALGSPEEQWLRNHSSYLAPGLGGKLRLLAAILLGLLLNTILIGALVAIVAILLGMLGAVLEPRLAASGGQAGALPDALRIAWTAVWVAGALGVLCALVATATRLGDEPGNVTMRAAEGLLGFALLGLAVLGLPRVVLVLRELVAGLGVAGGEPGDSGQLTNVLQVLGALGVPPLLLGVVHSWLHREVRSERFKRLRARLSSPRVAGMIAAPLLLITGFLLLYNLAAGWGWRSTPLLVVAASSFVLVLLYAWLDPTRSSLYTLYKHRLCSAFAVYRQTDHEAAPRHYRTLVRLSDSNVDDPRSGWRWPELIVCAAANVPGSGVTPPGSNGLPFVFTHRWIGGKEVGYIRTREYEQALGARWERDLTLPAAVAMSGAALSPTSGKRSSRVHTLLLTLANARLGVWLPNPRSVHRVRRRPRMTWLLRELCGLNRLTGKYLYITDGGHYENLGLLELLRRGCTEIYCFDASWDGPRAYATMAQAIATARTDLDIDIPLEPQQLDPSALEKLPGKAFATVTFRYPNGEAGQLVYVKALVTADAPWDIRAHQLEDPQFPNGSTREHMYSGERFEAYRKLGEWTATRALQAQAEPGSGELKLAG